MFRQLIAVLLLCWLVNASLNRPGTHRPRRSLHDTDGELSESAKNFRYGDAGWHGGWDGDDDNDNRGDRRNWNGGGHHDGASGDDNDDCECPTYAHDHVDVGMGMTGSVIVWRFIRHPNIDVGAVTFGDPSIFNETATTAGGGWLAWFTSNLRGAGPIGARQNPVHNHYYSREVSVAAGGHLGGTDQYQPLARIPCGAMCSSGSVYGVSRAPYWQELEDALGDSTYSYDYIREARKTLENVKGDIDLSNHGTAGPFSKLIYRPDPAQIAVMNATAKVLGIPIHEDTLDSTLGEIAGYMPRALKDNGPTLNPNVRYTRTNVFNDLFGVVNGVLPAYNNFHLYANFMATTLIWDKHDPLKVRGVKAIGANGQCIRLIARKSVLLTMGVVETAAFLQRNGIGDCAYLATLGISCRLNNPNVGKNIWNAVALSTTWLVKRYPHADTAGICAYFLSPQAKARGETVPNLQYCTHVLSEAATPTQSLLLWVVQDNRPRDRGTTRIVSSAFNKDPDTSFNPYRFFPDDRKDITYALLKTLEIAGNASLEGFPMAMQGAPATWTTESTILLNIDSGRPTSLTAAFPTVQPFATNWHDGGSVMMGPTGDPLRAATPRGELVSLDGSQKLKGLRSYGVQGLRKGADSHNSINQAETMGHIAYLQLIQDYHPGTAPLI